MNTVLEIPKLISSVVLEPPLTDEEFEKLCMRTESVKLERSKEGKIIVNPPAGLDSSSGNIEISRQLANWWCEHQKGRVFDSSAGFFLPDGSSLSPDGAYATAEQMCGLSREDRKRYHQDERDDAIAARAEAAGKIGGHPRHLLGVAANIGGHHRDALVIARR